LSIQNTIVKTAYAAAETLSLLQQNYRSGVIAGPTTDLELEVHFHQPVNKDGPHLVIDVHLQRQAPQRCSVS